MAANTNPIFSLTPNVGTTAITAQNTSSAGGGTIATDIFKAFTAGANGSWVSRIQFDPTATAAATATTATTLRAFISSQTSGATTAGTNTVLIGEISAAAQTADQTTTATASLVIPCNFALTPAWTILVTSHQTLAANTSWQVKVFGGDY